MDTDYKHRFDTAGFFHAPAFLDVAEVRELEENLDRFVRDIVPQMDRKDAMFEDYRDGSTLKQLTAMERDPWFDAFRKRPKFVKLAESLLNGPVTSKGVQCFRKPPRIGKATPPHQDGFYFCITPNEALTVWISLDDVTAEGGAVHYEAYSRHRGVQEHGGTGILGFSQGLQGAGAGMGEAVCCPVRRGDALVHHSLTVHWAGPNRSEQQRRAIGLVYFSGNVQIDVKAQERYRASVERQRAELGVK